MTGTGLPGWRRVAVVVVLIAVAAVALRSRAYAAVAHGVPGGIAHWTSTILVVALLGAGVVLGVLFAVSLRRRRSKENERVPQPVPVSPWARLVALVIVLAVFGAPIALLILRWRHGAGVTTLGRGVSSGAAPAGPGLAPSGHHVPVMPWWPWAVLAGAALLLVAMLVLRRMHATREPAADTSPDDTAATAVVVDAGLDALRRGADDDPRAAVLACYAAMERALARTDAGPRAADTPLEVVARAMDARVVPGEAAALADLFRRARYSTHAFGEADRSRAETALERVRHHTAAPLEWTAGASGEEVWT